jgi:CO/xanthine dehydrogenase Mo-binding subunit
VSGPLDDWLAVELDGTITAYSGKVEIGTGVRTALAQIVAEELDVPFERVRVVMGDTERTPDEGYTSGSRTLQSSGFALRRAAAEARAVLLELAGERLDALPEELTVHDGVVAVARDPERSIGYAGLLGGRRFERSITGRAPLKRPADYRVVGRPAARVDLPGKVTGLPSFVQDVRLPGMLHGRVVRPPGPGARLLALDEASAPGALVVRLGDFVGVLAEREEDAVRAAQALKTEWSEAASLPPMDELYEYLRRQPATEHVAAESGAAGPALARAARRLSATYLVPYQAHASLGPSCAVADASGGEVVVWSSAQGPYPLSRALADLLNVPAEQVRVIHVEGPGGYGQNGSDDAAADAAILSRAAGRPVRVQWSRQDEFAWEPYAAAMTIDLQAGLDEQGSLAAWEYSAWTPSHTGRPRTGLELLAGQLIAGKPAPARTAFYGGERNAPTNYTIPHQRVAVHYVASPLRTSSFRSLGAFGNTFANEAFMDELAALAGADPLEFRLRHLADPRARAVLAAAAERAGWGGALPAGEGVGLAFAQYENTEAYVGMAARVRVAASGAVRLLQVTAAHDCGLIVNPDGLRNQIEGNVIQAASRALKEQVTFDAARVTSVDWESYPILTFSEAPAIEVVLIDRPDEPALGAGEPAAVTAAPAIANAVFAATGARLRQAPFTPARVRAAMAAARPG